MEKYFYSDAWLVLLRRWLHAVCEEATESDLNKKRWHCKLYYSNLSMQKK